ncbi:MAG TPA: alpha-amylase/4-alpha-glucanotransferase domain-containing protein [Candidatus Eisenbacteria bacterium]|nr:alpha-amylase/4-alpha-glucanotransferase domain-containing protein [Candidatus Eisenbacteria bacterium]
MRPVTLTLIVHDHQPVGNFDGVFQAAYADAYAPFLAFLEAHPAVRIALHHSGPLLQWLALHQMDYLRRVRALADRGQVELWGGGFFEPILPAIPEVDRRGQIRTMADWLELELGRRPRGLWLAERVWEPGLASSLAAAGASYTAVDDAHFLAAGFERDDLWGYFLTEDQGRAIAVFPIHRDLRYLIPFGEPEQIVERLARVAEGGEGRIAVLGDDGEKFGVWPGTHARCYDQGWLERFADALAAQPWIELRTPAEALAHHPPRGLAYLPSASYHEMEEWSLPPAAQERQHRAVEILTPAFGDAARDLVRGGHWRNFAARYPEANRLHKRALYASHRLWEKPQEDDQRWREARTRLWRSQCNCPYWHGVFGGLYLPHLRSALYRDLIAVETYLGPAAPRIVRADLDLDGIPDALLETPRWAAWVSLRGGRLWAFDDRIALWNYGDTLARRPEAYHKKLREAEQGAAEGRSIHDAVRVKEPGLAALAANLDLHGRDSFVDRWSEGDRTHVWAETVFEAGEASAAAFTCSAREGEAPALTKRYAVAGDGMLEVDHTLSSDRSRLGRLIVELNLGLHVPQADDRWVEIEGERADPPHFAAVAKHAAVSRVAFIDAWAERRLDLWVDRKASLERAPIETVSLSEAGAERVFQGVEVRFAIPVALESGKSLRVRFRLAPGKLGQPA